MTVVVPFRPDGAERDRNWAWLRDRFATEHPGWEVIEAGCDDGEWNKPQAVNRAARQASGDVLVVSDADVFVSPRALDAAVAQAAHAPWVVPHRQTKRLTPRATVAVIEGADPRREPTVCKPRIACAGGGLFVLRAEVFWTAGGMDEQFRGWGFEDATFGLVLDEVAGPHVRLDAPLFHLWHQPQPPPHHAEGRLSDNRLRYRTYLEARGRLADFVKEP